MDRDRADVPESFERRQLARVKITAGRPVLSPVNTTFI